MYVPTNLNDSNYNYYYNYDHIVIYEGNDTCVNLYPSFDYLVTESYTCDQSTLVNQINYSNINSDIYYRIDLDKILIIFMVLLFIIVIVPFKLLSRLFGRWLKC